MESSWRLKLKRSLEHLYALGAAIDWWRESDPCSIVEDCDIESRKHRVWVKVDSGPDDPRLPLLIGDCVHTMRQSIDHLAYALAIKVRGADPPPNEEKTGFPIYSSKSSFDGGLPNKIGPAKHMPDGLYALLEGLQPYPGRHRQELAVLHALDNLDKHRFPPVVAAVPHVPAFRIEHAEVSEFTGPTIGPIDSETPVVEFLAVPDTEVSMNFDFEPQVAFDQGSTVAAGQFVWPMLNELRLYLLREVIGPVEAFL